MVHILTTGCDIYVCRSGNGFVTRENVQRSIGVPGRRPIGRPHWRAWRNAQANSGIWSGSRAQEARSSTDCGGVASTAMEMFAG
jgi:hypothetical protein